MSKEKQCNEMLMYWWEKAESSLGSARREFEAGAYDFAINRLYYATFYGVSSILLERKMSFKKHSGIRAYFHREFIKKGIIEVRLGRYYDKLFGDRQEADYTSFIKFDREYVSEQLELCGEFLRELKKVFNKKD